VLHLAEIAYPRINPIVVQFGDVKVHWYGITYILGFIAAGFILHALAKRGRWPIAPEKVVDVLFWGILGVFLGGRIGYILFYGISLGYEPAQYFKVWEGGMSFHGGLLGVILAYSIYCWKKKLRLGEMFDGLAFATTPSLFFVRFGNFINAELYGRTWDGPWAMRFPRYESFGDANGWQKVYDATPERADLFTALRHPSQLYEACAEGLLLFLILRWLMVKKGIGGGRIAGAFLILYGIFRFFIEFVREPDEGIGIVFLDLFTRGQQLCLGMVIAGLIVWWRSSRNPNPGPGPLPPVTLPATEAETGAE
jgi:phosphatidylglycerol:prolipoprotein diacylglycerol transferase